jgi:hypothetical protein
MHTEFNNCSPQTSNQQTAPHRRRRQPGAIFYIWICIALLLMIAGGLAQRGARADIMYDITNYASEQDGYTVSGTITIKHNGNALTETDLAGWSIMLTDSVGTTIWTMTNSDSTASLHTQFNATNQEITAPSNTFGMIFTSLENLAEISWLSSGGYSGYDPSGTTLWSSAWDPPEVIATAFSVPEPSTGGLAAVAAVTLITCTWSGHRREQRRQAAA